MAKEHLNGWVIKINNQYVKQLGGLVPLLREAKFFKKLTDAQQWERQNNQTGCVILPASKNTTTGHIRLKKGE